MGLALRAVGSAFRQVISQFTKLLLTNVIAAVLSLPCVVLAGVVAATSHSLPLTIVAIVMLAAILPNPMAAGVQFMAYELVGRQGLFISDQWDGLRRFGALAFRAWLLSVAGTAVIAANLHFYARLSNPISIVVEFIWLYALLIWLAMHLYVYPLIMEQEVKRLALIYRNAFVIVASRPFFTLVALASWLFLLTLASATGFMVIVGLALGAAIQQNAAARVLETFEQK